MAIKLIINTRQGVSGSLQGVAGVGGIIGQQVIPGMCFGLPLTGTSDVDAIYTLIGVLNGAGYSFNTSLSNNQKQFILRRVAITGAIKNDALAFQLIYETTDWGNNSAYLIRDSSADQSKTRNTIPGTFQPVVCIYAANGNPASVDPNNPGPNDIIDYPDYDYLAGGRVISTTALFFGLPNNSLRGLYKRVNEDPEWCSIAEAPTGVGYWRCSHYETQLSKYSGYYQQSMDFVSRVDEPWAECKVLTDPQTGKYLAKPSDMAALASQTYKFGIIKQVNAAVLFGPYKTANFGGTLGWGGTATNPFGLSNTIPAAIQST